METGVVPAAAQAATRRRGEMAANNATSVTVITGKRPQHSPRGAPVASVRLSQARIFFRDYTLRDANTGTSSKKTGGALAFLWGLASFL